MTPRRETLDTPDDPRDFAAVMAGQVTRGMRARKLFWLPPAVMLASGAALGAVVPRPAAFVVAGCLLPLALRKSLRMDPMARLRVDWSTAETHEKELTAGLEPDALAALREARQIVADNFGVPETHLLRMPAGPDSHDGPCGRCACEAARIGGVLWPSRTHPVLVVGGRLLDEPGLLRMVLRHEVRHSHRPLLRARAVRHTAMGAGPAALGLLVPPAWLPAAALVLLAALIGWSWAEEVICDVAAARHPAADARGWYTAALRVDRARPHRWLAWLAAPIHPPLRLRAALVTRLASRPGRRSAPGLP